jgi:hypothetical protein
VVRDVGAAAGVRQLSPQKVGLLADKGSRTLLRIDPEVANTRNALHPASLPVSQVPTLMNVVVDLSAPSNQPISGLLQAPDSLVLPIETTCYTITCTLVPSSPLIDLRLDDGGSCCSARRAPSTSKAQVLSSGRGFQAQ